MALLDTLFQAVEDECRTNAGTLGIDGATLDEHGLADVLKSAAEFGRDLGVDLETIDVESLAAGTHKLRSSAAPAINPDATFVLSAALMAVRVGRQGIVVGDVVDAIQQVAEAKYLCGMLTVLANGPTHGLVAEVKSKAARKAAAIRHQEHAELRADVFAWCEQHFHKHKSMDAAAQAILDANLVPVTFRTVSKWVGEWKKQSARRA